MQQGWCTAKVRHFLGNDSQGNPQYDEWRTIADNVHNLLTNAGKDLLHEYGYINIAGDSITAVGGNFIGLTEATITPDVDDTDLASEITADGLERAPAVTATHTPGANTSVVANTFTSAGSFTSVLASALFTETGPPPAGIMMHIANFGTGSGTLIPGDQLAVTWTITLS